MWCEDGWTENLYAMKLVNDELELYIAEHGELPVPKIAQAEKQNYYSCCVDCGFDYQQMTKEEYEHYLKNKKESDMNARIRKQN